MSVQRLLALTGMGARTLLAQVGSVSCVDQGLTCSLVVIECKNRIFCSTRVSMGGPTLAVTFGRQRCLWRLACDLFGQECSSYALPDQVKAQLA
jgi:hypothetical protein